MSDIHVLNEFFFFFNDTATTEIYTLSLHDALPIWGTITYFVLFTVLRFVLKRQTGVIGIADLLVVVLIADAIQNAMAGEYKSITEGVTLLLTIVGWNVGLDWLGHKFPLIERFLRAPPLLLDRTSVV